MTRLAAIIASIILASIAAAHPERLQGWAQRRLRSFPLLHDRLLQFIDRLLSDLERRYPIGAR